MPLSAMCVQKSDDSLSAIRIAYHIWLCSSSLPEPRDPLLKVLIIDYVTRHRSNRVVRSLGGRLPSAKATICNIKGGD
ncbi:hypothetical protein K402DRAFT_232973 [Aulographum hederae CBS 113979]|uniref:Uncharacterized protein n=1 Tax=Aulographum hederae CBS 113979 TaxID=1176131 RepID=A0A6G1GL41_9PEZI|nr:hypothetical protein K402DRAFT_253984 [Aulographum hederae CBS 113979]KAF1981641.1 hypothetical protein K402DRAFT_232973 [Aulographum hederae CBS 113979]